MFAYFNRFELELTEEQVRAVSAGGQDASEAVDWVLEDSAVTDQLDAIGWLPIRDELAEYGTWDAQELTDDDANRGRIVWIAGCDIKENELTD